MDPNNHANEPHISDPPVQPAKDFVIATYREITDHLGLGSVNAARTKAKRAKWEAEPINHPADTRRIRVPRDAWDQPSTIPPAGPKPPIPPVRKPRTPGIEQPDPALSEARERVARLEGELSGLRVALAAEHGRAEAAEVREKGLTTELATLRALILELAQVRALAPLPPAPNPPEPKPAKRPWWRKLWLRGGSGS